MRRAAARALEVDVDVASAGRPLGDAGGVRGEHRLGVRPSVATPRAVTAHVDEVGGERTGHRLLLPVVQTERDVRAREPLEHRLDQPRGVAHLQHPAHVRTPRERAQQSVEPIESNVEGSWISTGPSALPSPRARRKNNVMGGPGSFSRLMCVKNRLALTANTKCGGTAAAQARNVAARGSR